MWNIQEQEERDFYHASDAEWDRAGALEKGYDRPEVAWILSSRDVWYRNPYYKGPEKPHPEYEEEEVFIGPHQQLIDDDEFPF